MPRGVPQSYDDDSINIVSAFESRSRILPRKLTDAAGRLLTARKHTASARDSQMLPLILLTAAAHRAVLSPALAADSKYSNDRTWSRGTPRAPQ